MIVPKLELTEEFVLSQVNDVKYFYDDMLTICVMSTLSGFKIVGTSNCFSREKYSKELGMKYSREDATKKLFEHCAFYLLTINSN